MASQIDEKYIIECENELEANLPRELSKRHDESKWRGG